MLSMIVPDTESCMIETVSSLEQLNNTGSVMVISMKQTMFFILLFLISHQQAPLHTRYRSLFILTVPASGPVFNDQDIKTSFNPFSMLVGVATVTGNRRVDILPSMTGPVSPQTAAGRPPLECRSRSRQHRCSAYQGNPV